MLLQWVVFQMPLSLAGREALKQVLALPESQQLEIFRTLAHRTHSPESMPPRSRRSAISASGPASRAPTARAHAFTATGSTGTGTSPARQSPSAGDTSASTATARSTTIQHPLSRGRTTLTSGWDSLRACVAWRLFARQQLN